jgi:FtsX-like permease family
VIRFGLRLTIRGGKEAAVRLAVTAAAVALGVGLLLITLAGINAVNAQNARYAWLNTGPSSSSPARPGSTSAGAGTSAGASTAGHDPLWWLLRADEYHGQIIGRLDVAATGPRSPVPPGIAHLPGPGQVYVSPALGRLLRSTPASQLGDRYPGHQVGTIGQSALPSPDSLLIIIGHTVAQLSRAPGAVQVTSIQTVSPGSCNGTDCQVRSGTNANGIDLILSVVALAMLFPVLVFIAAATRLAAARREQRFAAMRLVGATPRQVSVISAVESTVAAAAGTAVGFGLFFLLRTPVAAVPFAGASFFPGDLSLSLADILIVAIGVPAAAAAAARLALRRVRISPLGVSRRVTPRAPRVYRAIPLLAGIGELAFMVGIGRPRTTHGQIAAYLPGFLLIMAGLIIAGPWLTMAGARVMARRTSRPASLIAGRRLADNPRAGFRAISGLILALFITSVAVGTITTIDANRGPVSGGPAASDTLVDQLADPYLFSPAHARAGTVASVPAAVLARLHSIHGVEAVTVIHSNPALTERNLGQRGIVPAALVSCAQLARIPALGRCPAGVAAASIVPPGIGLRSPQTDARRAPDYRPLIPRDLTARPRRLAGSGRDTSPGRKADHQPLTSGWTATITMPLTAMARPNDRGDRPCSRIASGSVVYACR